MPFRNPSQRKGLRMSKVTRLYKSVGQTWSNQEVHLLVQNGSIEIERLPEKTELLVALNKPLNGRTFQELLIHSNFLTKEVEYKDRWK
jgi:hypothetical protein